MTLFNESWWDKCISPKVYVIPRLQIKLAFFSISVCQSVCLFEYIYIYMCVCVCKIVAKISSKKLGMYSSREIYKSFLIFVRNSPDIISQVSLKFKLIEFSELSCSYREHFKYFFVHLLTLPINNSRSELLLIKHVKIFINHNRIRKFSKIVFKIKINNTSEVKYLIHLRIQVIF